MSLRPCRSDRCSLLVAGHRGRQIYKPALRDLAVKEKVRAEIERIFGTAAKATVEVDKDDKLNTLVRIFFNKNSDDALRIRELADSLSRLPQTYLIEQRPSGPAEKATGDGQMDSGG